MADQMDVPAAQGGAVVPARLQAGAVHGAARAGRGLRYLLAATLAATFALVVLGGIVRITGSGLGCPDWPRCYGQLIPPLEGAILIEYSHRLAASVVSVLLLATSAVTLSRYRRHRMVAVPVAASVALLIVQILLGAVTVLWELPASVVVVHLGTAMLILAVLCLATVAAWAGWPAELALRWDGFTRLAAVTAACSYLLVLTGALVAANHAGWACPDLPLCLGRAIPPSANPLGQIHMLHRYAAMFGSGLVLFTASRAWQTRQGVRPILVAAALAVALVFVQVSLGVAMVLTALAYEWIRAAHLLIGSAVWIASLVLAVLALRYGAGSGDAAPVRVIRKKAPRATGWRRTVSDYLVLTKPRIILLLLLTTLAAMFLAADRPLSPWLVLWTMLGGALAAGGANAVNMFLDRDVDALMGRTSRRPVPSQRINPVRALIFGLVLNAGAFVVLALGANLLAAMLALAGSVYYVLVYTRLLKRTTPQNIVVGGAAGAMPPLVGWAAVTGRLDLLALFLFAIIFYWTPPHFWALALLRRADYARAGIPMMPVARGEAETKWQILLYSVLLIAVSILPTPLRLMGPLYLVLALGLGLRFLVHAYRLFREADTRSAWPLYRYSLFYLALLFGAMVLDHMVRLAASSS